MRRTVVAVTLAAFSLSAWLASEAIAQDTKSARGTITAMTPATLTVKAGERDMTFTVDAKTIVEARGGGTAARKAEAAGKPGARLTEVLKIGEAVEVRYREAGGGLRADTVRRIVSAGAGGVRTTDEDTERSEGTVDSVTASSLTISGSSGGGAKFTQTFAVDGSTKVIGVGAGTATQAQGGRMVITSYIGKGDRVAVSYHTKGNVLHAAEIRVTAKAKLK